MSPSRAARRRRSAAPAASPPPSNLALRVLLIVAVGFATYLNVLAAPFIWDDQTSIVTNSSIQHLSPLSNVLSPPRDTPVAGRPLVNLSFALNYAAGGVDEASALGFRVTNLAIHIACALLLFGIVRRTFRRKTDEQSADAVALAIALLWMAHPLVTEVVDYVTQRSESMMALFLLLTLYCAIRARPAAGRDGTVGRQSADARTWQALAIAACTAGMATKESMVVAPIIVVLYDRSFEFGSFARAVRARAPLYTGLALSWTIAVVILWSAPRSTVGASTDIGSWTYLLNQTRVIARYLRLAIWPRGLVIDYGLPHTMSVADAVPGGLLIGALAALAVVALVRWPAIGFLGTSFFLLLAPTSSLIPIRTEVGADRRMYLPLAALTALAVIGVRAALVRLRAAREGAIPRQLPAAVTALLVVTLGATTIARNAEYRDPLVLWRADVERRPHGRSRMAYATELATAGRHAEAIEQLRLAVPDFPNARSALGTELLLVQKFDEGIPLLQRFIADAPSLPNRIPAHVLLAQAFGVQGKLDEAAHQWRAVLALSPSDRTARASLVQILSIQAQSALRQDDAARGEAYAREAVQLAPENATAFNLLGVALASRGRLEEAKTYFRKAMQIAPDDSQARNNLERAERALEGARQNRTNP